MVVLIILWAVDLPFSIALRWWADRHGLTEGSWADWLIEPWATLGGAVAFVMLQIAVIMGFARRFPRFWWLPVTPIFLVLAVAFSIALPYLDAGRIHEPRRSDVRQAYATLERQEGVDVPVDEEKVSDLTTQANALVEGLGPTMRVVIWDTLLDGRFSLGEIRFVLAHELGHVKHEHLYKGLGWAVLFAFPITFLLAELTRRRGGMGDPGVLAYGFLVLAVLGALVTPVGNVISRRVEAEADWQALETTKDPASGRGLFQEFSRDEPRPAEPAYLGVRLLRHPSDDHAADRHDGGLEAAPLGALGALFPAAAGRLREVADVFPARPLRIGVVHRVEQLVHEPGGHVHAGDDDSGHVAFLHLVVDARERERELVVREADVGEVRVDPGHHVRVDMDVQLSLLALVVFHAPTIYPWTRSSP